MIGSFAVRGVNHTLLHAPFSDERQIVYPPPFQPANPWWALSAPLNVWIGRLMEAGRGDRRGADRAAAAAARRRGRAGHAGVETHRRPRSSRAAHALEDRQIDFDLLDEGALDGDPALRLHARPRGGRLVVGQQTYRIVVVPQATALVGPGRGHAGRLRATAAARWW